MTAPLSPAAREALQRLADWLSTSTKSERVNLGAFIGNCLFHEPLSTAEPVSVLPEGDGTGEGLSEALRASEAKARYRLERAAEFKRQRNEAWAEAEKLREEVTRLRAEPDAVPSPGTRWSKALRERNAAWDELDALRAELTQLRDERDEARAAVKSLASVEVAQSVWTLRPRPDRRSP